MPRIYLFTHWRLKLLNGIICHMFMLKITVHYDIIRFVTVTRVMCWSGMYLLYLVIKFTLKIITLLIYKIII